MKDVLSVFQISKQADSKTRKRANSKALVEQSVIDLCEEVREDHSIMGCRKIHTSYASDLGLGRDSFLRICGQNGLFIKRKSSPVITTRAVKDKFVPNLIEGRTINKINQVWQSDIFYYKHRGRDYYVFTIIDVYSRKLLALHCANSLHAEHLLTALKMAVKRRKGQKIQGCIFHSDRGSQYFAKSVIKFLKDHKMRRSMGLRAQQNAYAERVQGTIKQEYLDHMGEELPLEKLTQAACNLYNNKRPHMELNYLTPTQFEEQINNQPTDNRPKVHIYQWVEKEFTILPLPNKKEKRSKKEKSTTTLVSI